MIQINGKNYNFNKKVDNTITGQYLIEDFNLLEPMTLKVSAEHEKSRLGIPQFIINIPLTVGCFKVLII